jgi:hypothetical protein
MLKKLHNFLKIDILNVKLIKKERYNVNKAQKSIT